MNKKQKLLTFIVAAILLLSIGSSCVQDVIIPAYIDKDAAAWAGVPTKLFLPYTTLWDVKRLGLAIDYKILMEKIKGGYYKNITNISILAGEEIKQVVFNPAGPMGLIVSGLGFGTLGAVLVKRPGDKSKKEVELEKANGKE